MDNIEYIYVCFSSYVGENECFLDLKYSNIVSQSFTDYTEMCKAMFRLVSFIEMEHMDNAIIWMNVYPADNPGKIVYTYYYAYLGKTNIGDRFYLTDKLCNTRIGLPYTDSRNIMRYRLEEITHFIPNKDYERLYKKAKLEVKFEKDMGQ